MAVAFALGNGKSRLVIDVAVLQRLGSVYGCNALYREHTPTVLVATDRPMAREIEESGYPQQHVFYTRKPAAGSGSRAVPTKWYGWSSGPIATALAAQDGYRRIFLLGHDLGSPNSTINNCYAGTTNYRPADARATYAGNWVKQISQVLKQFAHVEFCRVLGSESTQVDSLTAYENYHEQTLSAFLDWINTQRNNDQ